MTTHRAHALALTPSFASARSAPRVTRAPFATAALISLPIAITLTVLMVLAASLIGPFIVFAIPGMLAFGCAIGPLHALMRGEL